MNPDQIIGIAILVESPGLHALHYLKVGRNIEGVSWDELPCLPAEAPRGDAKLPAHFPENRPWRYKVAGDQLEVSPSVNISKGWWHNGNPWTVQFVRATGETREAHLRQLAEANLPENTVRLRAILLTMRTVTFKSVLRGIAGSLRMDPDQMAAADAAGWLEDINERVKQGVEHDFFAELTPVEQRAFRPNYADATAYAAGVEVYFPAADAYYHTLKATTGHAPATESGGVWTANSAYWAESAASYNADDWETGVDYAPGDQVRNPADGEFYGCHTAHTAGGTFDATKFGLLTPFARTIDLDQAGETPLGEVKRVLRRDPRVHRTNAGELKFTTTGSAIVVQDCSPSRVWVEFRIRPPVFALQSWADDIVYDLGDVVYDEDGTGNCFKSLQAANEDHAITDGEWWVVVPFPYLIAGFVKKAVYSDALRADGQTSAADTKLEEAFNTLTTVDDVATTGQGQIERATARSY